MGKQDGESPLGRLRLPEVLSPQKNGKTENEIYPITKLKPRVFPYHSPPRLLTKIGVRSGIGQYWILAITPPHFRNGTNDPADDGAPVGQSGSPSRKDGVKAEGLLIRNEPACR
jgi:hypothetical protein